MKALSLRPEWAMPVMLGWKTVECRTWQTSHRGDLLICASAKPIAGAIAGHALCIVTLDRIEPFARRHVEPAMLDGIPTGAYAWHLSNLRWIEPFAVKGKLHLFDVPDELIREVPDNVGNAEALRTYFEPLIKWTDRDTTEQETREWWESMMPAD